MNESNLRKNNPSDRFGRSLFGYDNCFDVSFVPHSTGTYHIFLYGEIENAHQFKNAIQVMMEAGEGDTVVVHLSTDGGCLDATDSFVSAMRRCAARVIVEASGGVHSAGTIILLNAMEFRLTEGFNALIHNGSLGIVAPKTSDAKIQSAFWFKRMDELARNTYKGFLTEEEIKQMIAGVDLWIGPEEWIERWNKRQQLLKEEAEETEEVLQNLYTNLTEDVDEEDSE